MPGPLLLDTHVFIWWRDNNANLGAEARRQIASAGIVFVSVASAWEAASKIALGKLRLPESFEAGVVASQFDRLPIAFRHGNWSQRCPATTTTPSIACSSRRPSPSD